MFSLSTSAKGFKETGPSIKSQYFKQKKICELLIMTESCNGLLGRAISCGSTYVRLGDCRPYVVGEGGGERVGLGAVWQRVFGEFLGE